MTELPIDSQIVHVIESLRERSLVLVAPPGSGKTTRVPPAILAAGLCSPDHPNLIVLQPRRVAARAAAARIADERGWRLGDQVGYHVRFDRRFSARTRLRFLTEGVLTRQLVSDPFLEGVGAVVLDEFHERSLDGDLALALLCEVRREARPDLIIVLMSATLDAEPVAAYLGNSPIVRVDGRSYPVAVEYAPADRPASPEAIVPVIDRLISLPRPGGHVLVFLPGFAEIRRVGRRLQPLAERSGYCVLPLHGSLTALEQDRALKPSDRRKIILSTNVAETSLTIDGVDTVIDSGLARLVRYDAGRGIDRWEQSRISRASADQRAGRAGRTGPGRCIRLWSERSHRGLAEFESPEIHRVDLCGALAGDPLRITHLGTEMLALPVHPRLARLLIEGRNCGRVQDAAAVAALLSERDIRARGAVPGRAGVEGRSSSAVGQSDVLATLDLLAVAEEARFGPSLFSRGIDPGAARQVALLRDQLIRKLGRRPEGATQRAEPDDDDILKWLLLAYPDRVVKRRGALGTGVMVGGRGVRLGPATVVRDPELYLALDARQFRRGGTVEIEVNTASLVRFEWLEELLPHNLRREQATYFDPSRRRVASATRLWYHDILLREDPAAVTDRALAGRVLAEALRPQLAGLVRANPQAALWLARLDFVRRHLPEMHWPEYDDEAMADALAPLCAGETDLAQIERADLVAYLESGLNPAQQRELAASAPLVITVPSGRQVRLVYEPGAPPVLAVRLQELFGWTDTPRIARGRVPVLLHLLAPNNRPVQITSDLPSFWTTTYHQVRKDLRRRYPKHSWPEDPFQAQAPVKGGVERKHRDGLL
jgi:ATP-dependent helicase HrpB